MEYLKDIIGLTGASPKENVLLVNDLTGIRISPIQDAASVEGLDVVWDRVLKNTNTYLKANLREVLSSDAEFLDVVANSLRPNMSVSNNQETVVKSTNYIGSRIRTGLFELCQLRTTGLTLVSESASTGVAIKIFNLKTGEEVLDSTQDVIIGSNRIKLDAAITLDAYDNDVFIGVDATDLDLKNIGAIGFNLDGDCQGSIGTSSMKLDLSDSVEAASLESSSNLVHVDWVIESDFQNVLETEKRLFAEAAQFMAGHFLLQESFSSVDYNLWTGVNHLQRQDDANEYKKVARGLLKNSANSALRKLRGSAFFKKASAEDVQGISVVSIL